MRNPGKEKGLFFQIRNNPGKGKTLMEPKGRKPTLRKMVITPFPKIKSKNAFNSNQIPVILK